MLALCEFDFAARDERLDFGLIGYVVAGLVEDHVSLRAAAQSARFAVFSLELRRRLLVRLECALAARERVPRRLRDQSARVVNGRRLLDYQIFVVRFGLELLVVPHSHVQLDGCFAVEDYVCKRPPLCTPLEAALTPTAVWAAITGRQIGSWRLHVVRWNASDGHSAVGLRARQHLLVNERIVLHDRVE